MIRVLFLITSLDRGGAERQLTLLLQGIDRSRFAVTVVTLKDGGALQAELEHLDGLQMLSVGRKGRWDVVLPVLRLARIIRRVKPHIIQSYLDGPNILALLLGKPLAAPVVWGFRASNLDFSLYSRRSAVIHNAARRLARFADLVVVNSHAGKRHLQSVGYRAETLVVVPNGFDSDAFFPDAAAGRRLRQEWGIDEKATLIGFVARLDPIKDHRSFLQAAAMLARKRANVRFVCVGGGLAPYRAEMQNLSRELGLSDCLVWAGERDDMRAVHSALDVATSSSLSEGFPNTVGEAMACGVPCVVTDVGDSALLVGSAGRVVRPNDPTGLMAAWEWVLDLPAEERQALAKTARNRIVSEFSVQQLVRKTEATLSGLVSCGDGSRNRLTER